MTRVYTVCFSTTGKYFDPCSCRINQNAMFSKAYLFQYLGLLWYVCRRQGLSRFSRTRVMKQLHKKQTLCVCVCVWGGVGGGGGGGGKGGRYGIME